MTTIPTDRIARRRSIVFIGLLSACLVLMAFSSNPLIREVQNGIGFAVTVASLQLLPLLARHLGWRWVFTVLAIGPALGAVAMARLRRVRPD